MRSKLLKLFLILGILIVILYNFPISRPDFEALYEKVDPQIQVSLQDFRKHTPKKSIEIDGTRWKYIKTGQGEESILFLHGMTGSYDIWWQQIRELSQSYTIISLTYPPLDNLKDLGNGIVEILKKESINQTNIIGSSLGGYFAQYLVAQKSPLIQKAIFANTFPPNDLISKKNATLGKILPLMPEWVVMKFLRGNTEDVIYPASGHSELVKAFILEQSYGMMSKQDFINRYYCVIDKFTPADLNEVKTPVLIIEADNDPLVDPELRQMLKSTYPTAMIKTLHDVGHFPYLNAPDNYSSIIRQFLEN